MTVQTFHAEIADVDEGKAVDFELERGEFSLHDGRIMHGAKPNTSECAAPATRCATSRRR